MSDEIELNPPSPADLATARGVLRRYGLTGDAEIRQLACLGTVENPREVMVAAGLAVMGMTCWSCNTNKLDPSDKDALGLDMCPACYEAAGLENEHSDYGHPTPVDGCPSCD